MNDPLAEVAAIVNLITLHVLTLPVSERREYFKTELDAIAHPGIRDAVQSAVLASFDAGVLHRMDNEKPVGDITLSSTVSPTINPTMIQQGASMTNAPNDLPGEDGGVSRATKLLAIATIVGACIGAAALIWVNRHDSSGKGPVEHPAAATPASPTSH